MADIFLSYSRKDFASVRPLVEALEKRHWTVYWDRHLEPGGEWPEELKREVERACCVVVAWSKTSVDSSWVRQEAESGRRRKVLIPVRLTNVAPPSGYEDLHAADLEGWDGTLGAAELERLVAAIRKLCGARGDVSIDPKLLLIVVGDPGVYRGVGPMLNLTCSFSNDSNRLAVIRRLDLEGRGPKEREYHLHWHLFFTTDGMQQSKVDATARIEVLSGEKKDLGVQFQGPLFGGGELWPVGEYAFDLLGWAHDRTSQEKPNLITTFRATLSPDNAAWLRHWQDAEASAWDHPDITDRAVGIPVPMHDIKLAR
jgi:hypothetical protein